jgi:uncharacterized protein with PIN domain
MIVDTSVLIAIIKAEPEAERFYDEIERAETVRISLLPTQKLLSSWTRAEAAWRAQSLIA